MTDRSSLILFVLGLFIAIFGIVCSAVATDYAVKMPHHNNQEFWVAVGLVLTFVGGILAGCGATRDQMIKDYDLAPKTDKKTDNK